MFCTEKREEEDGDGLRMGNQDWSDVGLCGIECRCCCGVGGKVGKEKRERACRNTFGWGRKLPDAVLTRKKSAVRTGAGIYRKVIWTLLAYTRQKQPPTQHACTQNENNMQCSVSSHVTQRGGRKGGKIHKDPKK